MPPSIPSTRYDRIRVDGTLLLTNQRAEPMKVDVQKNCHGESAEASGGTVRLVLRRDSQRWPEHELRWEVELSPGETRELTYSYVIRRW